MAVGRPIPHWRQGGRSGAATVERGKLGPRDASSTKLQAGTQSLTKTPWDSGWLTSAGRVEPEISSPEKIYGTLEMGAPAATQETERLGPGR